MKEYMRKRRAAADLSARESGRQPADASLPHRPDRLEVRETGVEPASAGVSQRAEALPPRGSVSGYAPPDQCPWCDARRLAEAKRGET